MASKTAISLESGPPVPEDSCSNAPSDTMELDKPGTIPLISQCAESASPVIQAEWLADPLSRNIKGFLRRTTNYISRAKPKKNATLLGPMTYNHSYLSRNRQDSGNIWDEGYLQGLCARLQSGISLTKVTRKKQVEHVFTVIDGVLSWRESKRVNLDTIKDVRCGETAKNYIDDYKASPSVARLWITIIYQVASKFRALHVVAKNLEDLECFHNGIISMVDSRRNLMKSIANPEDDMFANIHWQTSVSTEKSAEAVEVLTFEDVKELCSKFNIYCSDSYLKTIFKKADKNSNGLLNFTEFQCFVKLLKRRGEISRIWYNITNGKEHLTFEEFLSFIRVVQHDNITLDAAAEEFNKFRFNENYMNLDGFQKYLTSQPHLKNAQMNYSLPLNRYFISSSHNTYLQGKQLGETPTVETYVQVLQQGCRCIEIDVWDGDEGPVVCHGKLTSSLPLQNVIRVVRKYAFITSPYPLILSLEIHCRPANQLIMECILQEFLGDKIHTGSSSGKLCSPSELKHKFLIKVKKSKRGLYNSFDEDSASSTSTTSSSFDSETDSRNGATRKLSISKKMHVIEGLVSASAIHGVKLRNFSLPESKTPNHCFSLSEKRFENLTKDQSQSLAIDKHNRRFLMRVYPHAFRYKSSNFNPIKFWEMGVQMVATNWQTYDLGQQINKAMFQLPLEEDSLWHSGYVLKPSYLANSVNKTNEILNLRRLVSKRKVILRIEVLSAQLLPKPKLIKERQSSYDFRVRFQVCGSKPARPLKVQNGVINNDSSGLTHYCKDNGLTPTWGTEFEITLVDTFFNFLLFTIQGGELDLATCCLKLEYLRKGYRHIPLYNESGERFIFSTLFLRIDYDYYGDK